MKIYVLAAVLIGSSLSGCNKPSDRYQGIEKPPDHPLEQSPGTQPTTANGGAVAPRPEDAPGTEPSERPDALGTTRTPASVDSPGPAGATSPGTPGAQPAAK